MNANTKTLIAVGRQFCADFVAAPYVCYTEHGQHAYFFALLYAALPESSRYVLFNGHRICVIQKEYPTATNLGRSQRQHWDISVIKVPPPSANRTRYDYLPLQAAAEFGENVEFRAIDTTDREVFLEWGIYDGLYVNDKQIRTGPPPSYEKIKKKIAKQVKK